MIQSGRNSQAAAPIHRSHYCNHSDRELVAEYTLGDDAAFQEIVNRNRTTLIKVARRYGKNEEDAHDILQDAWLKASRNMHRFRNDSALSTWLYSLVKNCGYDYITNKSRQEQLILDGEDIKEDCNRHLSHDPSEQIDSAILLKEALKTLRPDQSAALVLIDIAGFNVSQVAQLQGVAEGTIKSRRGRARESLRAAFASAQ